MAALRVKNQLRATARVISLAGVAAAVLVLPACSGQSDKVIRPTTTTTVVAIPSATTSTTDASAPAVFSLYFVRNSVLGVSRRSQQTKSERYTALTDLMAGPNPVEKQAGLTTEIPSGAKVEGLSQVNGTSYVDVNGAFFLSSTSPAAFVLRLAQVVYTLTASPGVTGVEFLFRSQPLKTNVAGIDLSKPVTRATVQAAAGPLLLEVPAVGSTITSPLQVAGVSEIDGVLEIQLWGPTGKLLASNVSTTSVGETFDFTVPYTQVGAGPDVLKVYTATTAAAPTQLILTLSLAHHP